MSIFWKFFEILFEIFLNIFWVLFENFLRPFLLVIFWEFIENVFENALRVFDNFLNFFWEFSENFLRIFGNFLIIFEEFFRVFWELLNNFSGTFLPKMDTHRSVFCRSLRLEDVPLSWGPYFPSGVTKLSQNSFYKPRKRGILPILSGSIWNGNKIIFFQLPFWQLISL